MLEREPRAGAPEAALHLVDDQQRLALVAQPADTLQVRGRRGHDAALALHRFEHDGRDTVVERGGERVEVVERNLPEPARQRLERLLLLGLAGRRERGERAAVERAVRADHVVPLGTTVLLAVTPRELDRALVRLGAGVGEEHASVAAEQRVEALGDARLHVVVIEVRDVQQRARLLGDRVGDFGVRVAERRDREPAEEVEVPVALAVPQVRALAPHERDGRRP